jgi:uncharacterized Ntn-hydrolase superfamily protein
MTFSIVARSSDGESWGVAVASRFLAVGSVVPAAVAGLGAIAVQAEPNVAWKGLALSMLDDGGTAPVVLQRLLEDDDAPDDRQVGLVDHEGTAAAHTGDGCLGWAGHRLGPGVTVQGNVLTGPEVLAAMLESWDTTTDEPELARRLLAALQAGDRAGGDKRGRQSAALLVVREEAGYGGLDDIAVDLRVDDHPEPSTELGRLLDLNRIYLTASSEDERVPLDGDLRTELEGLARAAGQPDLSAWIGFSNYEMRADPDGDDPWVDELVIRALRATRATG